MAILDQIGVDPQLVVFLCGCGWTIMALIAFDIAHDAVVDAIKRWFK